MTVRSAISAEAPPWAACKYGGDTSLIRSAMRLRIYVTVSVATKTARSPTCGNKPTLLSVSPQCHADFFVPYNLIRRQNQGYRQLLGYHSPCQESAGLTDVMIVAPATISPAWRRSPAFTTAAMATTRCRMVPKTKRKGLNQLQGQHAVMNKIGRARSLLFVEDAA
jgi:hypothetical protein